MVLGGFAAPDQPDVARGWMMAIGAVSLGMLLFSVGVRPLAGRWARKNGRVIEQGTWDAIDRSRRPWTIAGTVGLGIVVVFGVVHAFT